MSVCKLSKIEFFIFSPANGGSISLYIQVPIDNQFLQCENFQKVLHYLQNILLPEIKIRNLEHDFENSRNFYCHCQRPGLGQMIGCDNSNCEKDWVHNQCVGFKPAPKRKWICSREHERKRTLEVLNRQ